MDPISIAGLGLGITSLLLQAFAGCVKGYEVFSDMVGMPAKYQYLKVRMRIEHGRLLSWGEQIGLLEEILEQPSQPLHSNRNLILDVLLEVHALFRSCLATTSKYDNLVAVDNLSLEGATPKQSLFLQKIQTCWKKPRQAATRLHWAMIKGNEFENLILRLVAFNESLESFLDRSAMKELRSMQEKSSLILLQLSEQVSQLQDLTQALQVDRRMEAPGSPFLSRSSTLHEGMNETIAPVGHLAAFKSRYLTINGEGPVDNMELSQSRFGIQTPDREEDRVEIQISGKTFWIEWRVSDEEIPSFDHQSVIEDRLSKLAFLLSLPDKPAEFRTPKCLGYCRCESDDEISYGLAFEYSVPGKSITLTSLRKVLDQAAPSSLTRRISLAVALAESLLYLHAVNWLHKGFRSDNILFAIGVDELWDNKALSSPIVSGFDFSRPDLQDETSIKSISRAHHDYYRHPKLLQDPNNRHQKMYDIYGLGVVLVEIAFWQPIERIMETILGKQIRRGQIIDIREHLLSSPFGKHKTVIGAVEAQTGEMYGQCVKLCLEGGSTLGVQPRSNESDPKVASKLQEAFYDDVLQKLKSLQV